MKKILTTTAALAALAWLIPSTTASAQEETTIEEALEELQRGIERGASSLDHPYLPAIRILRQVSAPRRGRVYTRPRPAAELDVFADRLAAMAADASLPEHVRRNARIVMAAAARLDSSHGGKPYARAFDLLVHLYEGGIPDRAGLDANHDYDDNWSLGTIFRLDPERGPAYVRDVFERSERPPICPVSPSIFRESGDTTWVFDDESKSWVVWDPPRNAGGEAERSTRRRGARRGTSSTRTSCTRPNAGHGPAAGSRRVTTNRLPSPTGFRSTSRTGTGAAGSPGSRAGNVGFGRSRPIPRPTDRRIAHNATSRGVVGWKSD